LPRHFESLSKDWKYKPAINQIEIHPLYNDEESIKASIKYGFLIVAYAPLANANKKLFTNYYLASLAAKYMKTIPQITLR